MEGIITVSALILCQGKDENEAVDAKHEEVQQREDGGRHLEVPTLHDEAGHCGAHEVAKVKWRRPHSYV